MVGHILHYNEKLHHTIMEGAIERQKPPSEQRNTSQLNNIEGLIFFATDRKGLSR